jgi:hypothetical protein
MGSPALERRTSSKLPNAAGKFSARVHSLRANIVTKSDLLFGCLDWVPENLGKARPEAIDQDYWIKKHGKEIPWYPVTAAPAFALKILCC